MLRLVVLSYVLVISSCNWRDPRVRKLLGPNFEPLPSAHHRGSRVPMSLVRSMLSGNDGFRLHFDDASPTPDELNPKDGAFTGSLYNLWYHLAPPDLNTLLGNPQAGSVVQPGRVSDIFRLFDRRLDFDQPEPPPISIQRFFGLKDKTKH
ncbi:uncharacterized protein LOC142981675 isoform X2 [Anticarsia gemmatalis]|uniref:uncharacterized protein LOC142981675 isoform X2 n=1 Tax=Anticarsia gemmatalis TaxID=129554 RepID=UPI003F76D33F